MNTLYQSLKKPYKVKLSKLEFKYPTLHENVLKTLNTKFYWSEMTIQEAGNLTDLLGLFFSIQTLHEIFDYEQ